MLGGDIDDPVAKAIFAAFHAMGAVLTAANPMTVAAREERLRLLDSCEPAFAELRRLSRDQFADRPSILPIIDEFERSVARLAKLLGVPDQGPSAEFNCPACGAVLERKGKDGLPAPENPTRIYCSACFEIIMPSLTALESVDVGFGTEAI